MATENNTEVYGDLEGSVIEWEEDDVEDEDSKISLCLIGKVRTKRSFNAHAFLNQMERIWNLKHIMESKEIDENGFIFQFFH